MLKLNTTNLHAIHQDHGLSPDDLSSKSALIPEYLEKIHARNQGFYTVIDNQETVEEIKAYAKSVEGKYEHIVVLAIGGSSLGTICLQQSLTHLFSNELKVTSSKLQVPRLHVLDNIDPCLIKEIQDIIDLPKTLFIVVTKSGGTPETLSEYFYFRSLTDAASLDAKEHFVFVTDPDKGLLRKIANEQGITAFDVPPNVGGRFSVQTPVGLLPAVLIGIDIDALLKGLQSMRDKFLSESFEKNLPFQIATMQYLLNQKGKIMNVIMPYSQRLIRFADWYRQLLAESIGKSENEAGKTVNVGITPINALGATDQHSQSQLYNEGPNDKFFMFLRVNNFECSVPIPNLHPDEEKVNYIKNTSFEELINIELQATAQSFTENDRPNITIDIEKVNAEALGQLFMLFEGATAFLGEYFGINAFNQPGVELAKINTKKLLLAK